MNDLAKSFFANQRLMETNASFEVSSVWKLVRSVVIRMQCNTAAILVSLYLTVHSKEEKGDSFIFRNDSLSTIEQSQGRST